MSAHETLKKYSTEVNRHDFKLLLPLLASDCTFWFTSGTYVGLEATRGAFEKTWGMIQNEVYRLEDVTWIAEDTAAAACTYTYHWEGLIKGEKRAGKGRGTSVFRRDKDGWKIVHEHLSAFPPAL